MQNLNSLCFCNWRPPWICLRLLPAAGMHYLKFIPNLCEKNKKNTSCLVPDGLVWIGYYTCRSTDRVSGLLESRGLSGRSQVKSTAEQRPVRVNNAERIYFPPIFQQENASCTAAARIAYMFTYEMNAARRLDASVEKNFKMYTVADGSLHIAADDVEITSDAGYMLSGSWHHYAVTYQYGNITFYRDGKQFGQSKPMQMDHVALSSDLVLGGESAPFYGVIDEFQVWNKALSLDQIRQYANAPIWPDGGAKPEVGEISSTVSEAMKGGLLLYSAFNQNSGDVKDLTTNNNTGRREGFGPDGDAWSSAKGIFWLNFNERKLEDVTAQYLTNYKAPFAYVGSAIFTDPIFGYKSYVPETETENSAWVMENVAEHSVPTGFHVTDGYNYNLVVEAGRGFATEIPNLKLYHLVDLPAGFYQFAVNFGPYYKFLTSYLVVNKGEGLPDAENLSDALVFEDIANQKVSFQLSEPTTVSLGVLVDWRDPSNWGGGTISEFILSEIPYDEMEANGETTGVANLKPQTDDVTVRAVRGGLYLSSDEPQMVQIYTMGGVRVFADKVVGTRPVPLKSGIYIVNKMKVFVP